MEILGVGPAELAFIVIIALILLGPKDMVAAGRSIGKTLRNIVTSPTWQAIRSTKDELQQLPTRLMREAGLEEELRNIDKEVRDASRISIDSRLAAPGFEEQLPNPPPASLPSAEQNPGSNALPKDPGA
jgi:Sec-independent protein translocase protein TatA